MTSALLIYPFFRRRLDRSRFRFPPLGVAYVAASLREAGHSVQVLDCTFLSRDEAVSQALAARADVVGIYCMATMKEDCLGFARALRGRRRESQHPLGAPEFKGQHQRHTKHAPLC